MSFSVVFFFYQTHRATRRYGYLGAEKILQIFGCTDHIKIDFISLVGMILVYCAVLISTAGGPSFFSSAQNVIGVCPASPQVRTPPKGNLEPLYRYYVSYLVGRYTWVPTGSTVNNDIGEKTRQKLMTRKTIEVLYLSFGQTFQTDGGSTIATEALPNHCN